MTTFLQLNNRMINLDHVVQAKFTEVYPGGEDDEDNPGQQTDPRHARLELTLTSVHADVHDYDFSSGFLAVAASESDTIRITGHDAELAWDWMQRTIGAKP